MRSKDAMGVAMCVRMMCMFGKKKAKVSTSRFVQRAIELDTFHLFRDMPMTAAISKVYTSKILGRDQRPDGYALGVMHDHYGHGGPLLPVEIEFVFEEGNEKVGRGEIYRGSGHGEHKCYQAKIWIFDPDGAFFADVQNAGAHAAMSGSSFLHLNFAKERVQPIKMTGGWRDAEEEDLDLKALMRRIDSGDEEARMPSLEFDYVSIVDMIHTNAPAWSYAWEDHGRDRPGFHSREAAKWRSYEWNN